MAGVKEHWSCPHSPTLRAVAKHKRGISARRAAVEDLQAKRRWALRCAAPCMLGLHTQLACACVLLRPRSSLRPHAFLPLTIYSSSFRCSAVTCWRQRAWSRCRCQFWWTAASRRMMRKRRKRRVVQVRRGVPGRRWDGAACRAGGPGWAGGSRGRGVACRVACGTPSWHEAAATVSWPCVRGPTTPAEGMDVDGEGGAAGPSSAGKHRKGG